MAKYTISCKCSRFDDVLLSIPDTFDSSVNGNHSFIIAKFASAEAIGQFKMMLGVKNKDFYANNDQSVLFWGVVKAGINASGNWFQCFKSTA